MADVGSNQDLLSVRDLGVSIQQGANSFFAVCDISFSVKKGQIFGLVGESGCGKSLSALSILRLLPQPTVKITRGSIRFDGIEVCDLEKEKLHRLRGNRISMIFQEPLSALNPVKRIGDQIAEILWTHKAELGAKKIHEACISMLRRVGIPSPDMRFFSFPHELSGGMRQRVMIAMALVCQPDLLIADEPTTALDVTIQAQILSLLRDLQIEHGMSMLLITHDFGVIAQMCDEVAVMYAGKIVESGPVGEVLESPRHPYTRGLVKSIPTSATVPKSHLEVIDGSVPSLDQMGVGCRFANRCSIVRENCRFNLPDLVSDNMTEGSRKIACHYWKDTRTDEHRTPKIG